MDERVRYKPSAFKHGVTQNQILHVLDDPRYECPVEIYENKYLVLGFDAAGNLLEIMYNEMKGGGIEEPMNEMTDEEADYWDEFFTKNPPTVDPAKKGGYFTRQRELLNVLDRASADYIIARAEGAHKTPAEIIGELVREKVAAES
ncbi:MAG: hypothetical protein LBD20_03265 [Spirochaetaceae bacterium]|jgi:hypothetical protein|nr:hypothetical protein [Spirochaetaceae bacterium]